MFGRKSLRKDLEAARKELVAMQNSLSAANRKIQAMEGKIPDIRLPYQKTGQLVYPSDNQKLPRPNIQLAEFHTVGSESARIFRTQDPSIKGKITVYLQENGYGDRRLNVIETGDTVKHGSNPPWETMKTFEDAAVIMDWLHQAPDAKLDTPLPKNADPEDRSWEALGMEYK